MITNLLEETLNVMKSCHKDWVDIDFIAFKDNMTISVADFKKHANAEYDSGFGGAEVSENLVIVFKDGSWLERAEYDGSEWWEYKKTPEKPLEEGHLTRCLTIRKV